jgi:hypothetical protein
MRLSLFLSRRLPAFLAGFLVAAAPSRAFATLGGTATSVEVDRARIRASTTRITPAERFTIHEMQTTTGATVREFVSASGTVFGVAWQGPWMPDMQQLLGEYFTDFQRLSQPPLRHGRGPFTIETPGLVAYVTGHQRAFSGVVYVPRLVPAGVTTQSIR